MTWSPNLRPIIDVPTMKQLAVMPPATNNNGGCFVYGGRRFIYWLVGAASTGFWRYDTFTDGWQQLAASPVSVPAAAATVNASNGAYCKSRERIYFCFAGSTGFYYYDVKANAWSAALTVAPVAASNGASLEHTCVFDHASGNDDYIYYFPGDASALKLHRYSISGNSWSEMGTNIIPAAPSSGANLYWLYTINTDYLLIVRGAATRTGYIYSISGNSILATIAFNGSLNTISVGSSTCFNSEKKELIWIETGTRNLVKTKLDPEGALETGTATAGAATTLTNSAETWYSHNWTKCYVTITSGTGAGQTRYIKDNTATVLTVYPAWTTNPDATSVYEIKNTLFDYGTATAGAATTLTDSTKVWLSNAWTGQKVKIIAGTGSGQVRYIATNTATALTVTAAWGTNPSTDSKYEILGFDTTPETQVPYGASVTYVGNTMVHVPVDGQNFIYFSRKGAVGDFFRYLETSP